MDLPTASALFTCLASPHRLQAFRALVTAGHDGLVAGQISAELGILPSAASFHLKSLLHAGLVSVSQEGRHLRYRANLALMRSLNDWLVEACCGGNPEQCWPRQAQADDAGEGRGCCP